MSETALSKTADAYETITPPSRVEVEEFVADIYKARFGSVITRFYPNLLSLQNNRGQVIGAIGWRLAADAPLFLEHYLDRPVEVALAAKLGTPVARSGIVEIGGLAARGRGASVALFVGLARQLHRQRLRHAVVTGTIELRRSFARFGFDVAILASARAEELPDRGALWGRYYSRDPQVLAGSIPDALTRLESCRLGVRHDAAAPYRLSLHRFGGGDRA